MSGVLVHLDDFLRKLFNFKKNVLIFFFFFFWMFLLKFIFLFFAPLEQFEIIGYFFLLFFLSWFVFFYFFICSKLLNFSKYGTNSFVIDETMFLFVNQQLSLNIGKKNQQYLPFIYFLFMIIIISNFFGLLPYNGAPTASVFFTLALTTSTFCFLVTTSVLTLGINFFCLFHHNTFPKFLLKFLIIIEFVSYLIRFISLPVRLIANLISGHALLKILVGFVLSLFSLVAFLKILIIFP
jgi:ATP synthase subunit 6